MPPEIYRVADNLPGSLFIMPCPSGDHLGRDIGFYRDQGVDTVVSMLAPDEADMLGLSHEAEACTRAGIEFLSSPIKDFGLPDVVIFDSLVAQIAAMLSNGRHVAVHCRAGVGRSGMVTAATLIALGSDADNAVRQISSVRGVSIPDTVEQGRFIAEYAKRENPSAT
ncbi:MAG: protein-tyrosine phosphatase family protein [Sulfitobacter sp.]